MGVINFEFHMEKVSKSILMIVTLGYILFSFKIQAQSVITINNNLKITNKQEVNLKLIPAIKPELMSISNDSLPRNLKWQTFQSQINWILSSGDGQKIIYIHFKDKWDQIERYDATIILDTKAPEIIYLAFENGSHTKSIANKLLIELDDNQGVSKMMISPKQSFKYATWLNYRKQHTYSLKNHEEDSEHTVYVKVRDEAGNESEVRSIKTILDQKGPYNYDMFISPLIHDKGTGKYYLNINKEQVKIDSSQSITIELKAEKAKYMKLSDHINFDEVKWQFFVPKKNLTIDIKHKKTVTYYVSFSDLAQNKTPFISKTFYIDLEAPYATSIEIIREQAKVDSIKHRNIKLNLFAIEADSMIISENPNFEKASFIPYKPESSFLLSPEQNQKILYVQFKDFIGNLSPIVSDTVILDTIPPQNLSFQINEGVYNTESHKLTVQINADKANFYQLSQNKDFRYTTWVRFTKTKFDYLLLNNKPGVKKIYLRFSDIAGNISEVLEDSVLIDQIPVPVFFDIENGKPRAKVKDNKVTIRLHTKFADKVMLSDNPEFGGAKWIPYTRYLEWQCSLGDGLKPIYAKFKSFTNKVSQTIYREIYIDNTPPQGCKVTLNDGKIEEETNLLTLKLEAIEAISMQFAYHDNFDKVSWRPYHSDPILIKQKKYGEVQIYARFKDAFGNISQIYKRKIKLSIKPSDCQVRFLNGRNFANQHDKKVYLKLFARDAKSMKISLYENFENTDWIPYTKNKSIELKGIDGLKTIYVKFKSITNTESYPIKTSATLDTQAPSRNRISVKRLKWIERFNEADIQIQVSSQDAVLIQISENEKFTNTVWKEYTDLPFNYTLKTYTSGLKTIYIRFQDYYKNTTETFYSTVYIEPIQNFPKAIINQGNTFLKSQHIKVDFKNVLVGKDMRISTIPFGEGKNIRKNYRPFKPSFEWRVPNGDGKFNIYVEYRDSLDKVYSLPKIPVTLDRIKPELINFKIKETYCNRDDRIVELLINTQNAQKIQLSNYPDFRDSKWEKYKRKKQWRLSEGDGKKTVYLKLGDWANNETEAYTAEVLLDNQDPIIQTFIINKDETYANKRNVKLHIESDDATEIIISNYPSFTHQSTWQNFQEDINWILDYKEGLKKVYIRLKDIAGNTSPSYLDSIILDTDPPIVHKLLINNGKVDSESKEINITMEVEDAEYMCFSNSKAFSKIEWLPYADTYQWRLKDTGLQHVYAIFKDKAGNICLPYTDDITVY